MREYDEKKSLNAGLIASMVVVAIASFVMGVVVAPVTPEEIRLETRKLEHQVAVDTAKIKFMSENYEAYTKCVASIKGFRNPGPSYYKGVCAP